VVVIASIFIYFNVINYNFSLIIEERNLRIENINAKIENLKSKGELNLSKKDVEAFFKFDEKRVFWAPKIMALTQITPKTMSITQIQYLRKKLNISAITELEDGVKEFDVVEDFISKLKSNDEFFKDFESIKFLSSSQDNVRGHKTFTFKIEAKLKSKNNQKNKKESTSNNKNIKLSENKHLVKQNTKSEISKKVNKNLQKKEQQSILTTIFTNEELLPYNSYYEYKDETGIKRITGKYKAEYDLISKYKKMIASPKDWNKKSTLTGQLIIEITKLQNDISKFKENQKKDEINLELK
jgi:hypothetical protein